MKKKKPDGKKYYTVEEANKALPLVGAIVKDIVALAGELREQYDRMERIPDQGETEPSEADNETLRQGHVRMKEYIAELTRLGVELKDFQMGLVDFHSILHGREVSLCWLFGEPEVAFWHELDAGFVGRQKLETCSMPTTTTAERRTHALRGPRTPKDG